VVLPDPPWKSKCPGNCPPKRAGNRDLTLCTVSTSASCLTPLYRRHRAASRCVARSRTSATSNTGGTVLGRGLSRTIGTK